MSPLPGVRADLDSPAWEHARRRVQQQPASAASAAAFCDKLIEPRWLHRRRAATFLYTYEDISTGRRFMGCMNKVFKGEIDLDLFLLAERTGGFGGIKMNGTPLPQCQFSVERPTRATAPPTSA